MNDKDEKKLTTMIDDLMSTGRYEDAKLILDQTNKKEYKHFDKYQNRIQTHYKKATESLYSKPYDSCGV